MLWLEQDQQQEQEQEQKQEQEVEELELGWPNGTMGEIGTGLTYWKSRCLIMETENKLLSNNNPILDDKKEWYEFLFIVLGVLKAKLDQQTIRNYSHARYHVSGQGKEKGIRFNSHHQQTKSSLTTIGIKLSHSKVSFLSLNK